MRTQGWRDVPMSPAMSALMGSEIITCRAYQRGPLNVLFTTGNHGVGGLVRHVSVSCADRYPSWDEIKDVRNSFFEDRMQVAQFLPPPDQYVNIHPNCFHLWAKANGSGWS